MRLSDFDVLTFDTFGTLIDWESGLYAAISDLAAKAKPSLSRDTVLEQFGAAETAQQAATPGMRYSELLSLVYRQLANSWDIKVTDEEAAAFGGSVGAWPAFDDAPEALAYLGQHFKMITLTNCDRTSYRGSAARLGEPWDAIYTAEDVGSYKPDLRNFDYLLDHVAKDFGKAPDRILHVAQSLYHDHVPATRIGLRTAWIDRRHDADGYGATAKPDDDYRIDFRFTSMAELAAAHRAERG